ncbi:MAG TPA: hypothetical protein VK087_02970 [Tissierellaceae bacterium]|nr:hypothetical protein [Tissierellaceae bacterium]
MENFDKITIQEMSKDDMLLIIHALEYTGKNTNIEDFITLKNSFIKELSYLAEVPEDEFLSFLQKETQSY